MKTFSLKSADVTQEWYIVDASGQTLGRLATFLATRLMGKYKTDYTPHVVSGDKLVVINAAKIKVTGNKLEGKIYYRHSGYPGSIRATTLAEQLEKDPTRVITHAVKGMLPKNKLAPIMLSNLRVFAGSEHSHDPQQPKTLEMRNA